MESLTVYIKDKAQLDLLYQFLKHLDFVILSEPNAKKTLAKHKDYSLFNSAGMWENRTITQEDLRAQAWKRM